MAKFFMEGGVFMWPILIIALVNLALAVRGAIALGRRAPGTDVLPGIHAVLFWGSVAALLGLLGQNAGLYKAFTVISQARAIAPNLVAMGLAESLTTTIFGFAVLACSAIVWFGLRSWHRRVAAS